MLQTPVFNCRLSRSGQFCSISLSASKFSVNRRIPKKDATSVNITRGIMIADVFSRPPALAKRKTVVPEACAQAEGLAAIDGLLEILQHPDEIYPLVKHTVDAYEAEKDTPTEPHWAFCYSMIHKMPLLPSFIPLLQQLNPDRRNSVLIFSFICRALDTIEDDMSLSSEVKIPILKNFHIHIYDCDWHFSCGSSDYRVLMDKFHLVRQAFLEIDKRDQDLIKDVIKRMGVGMANYLDKEIETMEALNEYSYYVSGIVAAAVFKIFQPSRVEDLDPEFETVANSYGLLIQKADIICDYLEDIEEIPKPRMFWPREIWSKYVSKLEDLKYKEYSVEAVQCLNEMVTNCLIHVKDCFKFLSTMENNPVLFRCSAFLLVSAIGTLTLFYNNIDVFRVEVKLRKGLKVKIMERTTTMSDVYTACFEYCCLLKSKVDKRDPSATETLSRLTDIKRCCIDSGMLDHRKFYILWS